MWVLNTHFDHKGGFTIVLMGVFNSAPDSNAMRTIASKLDDSIMFSTKKHYGPVGTFNGFDPSIVLSRRIEYIFVQNTNVISHAQNNDKRPDGHYVSDHLPVLAIFSL